MSKCVHPKLYAAVPTGAVYAFLTSGNIMMEHGITRDHIIKAVNKMAKTTAVTIEVPISQRHLADGTSGEVRVQYLLPICEQACFAIGKHQRLTRVIRLVHKAGK